MATDNTDPGIRQINQWAPDQLERTRKSIEATRYPDDAEKQRNLAFIDAQIAEKRAALAE